MLTSILTVAALVAGAGTTPLGVWNTSDGDSQVRIDACGEAICGYPVTPSPAADTIVQVDVHNPDPSLRARPMSKIQIFKLDLAKDGLWRGWIYSPRNGKTYKAALKMNGPERLKLSGCLVGPLCSSQTWTRSPGQTEGHDAAPS